ncbi:hypothetical protein [Bradyrhizobium ottawaense]|uniref:hypothetical protein n=1 Tax=Bradyrhizobium ottawaense TaxID=931866 RepID=UPI001BA83E76|nr:hypothetical protein [Bradyrhizobium ottawaense]MBR1329058.1 hypothetical protein [Bradyrhizobium ottawaense]
MDKSELAGYTPPTTWRLKKISAPGLWRGNPGQKPASVPGEVAIEGGRRSEQLADLLFSLETNISRYSEQPLILLRLLPDFDSAIRRFDPSRPSQISSC